MRVFQNCGITPAYFNRLRELSAREDSFLVQRDAFLNDRYGAVHTLGPVLRGDPGAFFTNGDDESLQRAWAREQGMPASADLSAVLLAQIEHHRADVFYNLDPLRYGSEFVRRLPGTVRRSIAWRAAPSPGADFAAYDLVVCNFPSILEQFRQRGYRTAYFLPSYDPEMAAYAAEGERPIDVVFVGAYSRHHTRRARILEAVAALAPEYRVVLHLDRGRLTKLAESAIGSWLPLSRHRRPKAISAASQPAIFGRELYRALARSKVVVNCAIDMSGDDRGNMRCFEAMGCGALMVSDQGRYPEGFENGSTIVEYADAHDAVGQIRSALADEPRRRRVATAGHALLRDCYSKDRQWADFERLVGEL